MIGSKCQEQSWHSGYFYIKCFTRYENLRNSCPHIPHIVSGSKDINRGNSQEHLVIEHRWSCALTLSKKKEEEWNQEDVLRKQESWQDSCTGRGKE
jgi:hypothetical protein